MTNISVLAGDTICMPTNWHAKLAYSALIGSSFVLQSGQGGSVINLGKLYNVYKMVEMPVVIGA